LLKLITGANDAGFDYLVDGSGGHTLYTVATGSSVRLWAASDAPFTGQLFTANFSANNSVGAGSTVTIDSDNQADRNPLTKIQIKVTWSDSTDRYTTIGNLPIVLTPFDGLGFIEIESVFKPVSAGTLSAAVNNPNAPSQVAGTLAPNILQSPSYQRVRIFPIPVAAVTLNVLGKKPFIPLSFPTEIPAIRNLDNCLIAFAMGDMFVRARFPAEEAQPHFQEGEMLLKELALLETVQAAHYSTIEPDSGFGQGVYNPRRGTFSDF
jgi:hypothetical protein